MKTITYLKCAHNLKRDVVHIRLATNMLLCGRECFPDYFIFDFDMIEDWPNKVCAHCFRIYRRNRLDVMENSAPRLRLALESILNQLLNGYDLEKINFKECRKKIGVTKECIEYAQVVLREADTIFGKYRGYKPF